MNVVSLLPSATEIVYALGVEPVAVSHECDFPPEAAEQPAVVRSRVDAGASSGEIDAQVLEAASDGGVYELDREALVAADPDVVVSQGVCDVCAVDSAVVTDAVRELGLDCEVVTTDPHSLGDIYDDIRAVARALDREERADQLITGLRERVERVQERAPIERPRVAVLDWTNPVMVAGHWVPELVAGAGGEYGLADPRDHSTPREWSEIREYDPEVLVVAPCGFGLDQTRENLGDLTELDGWNDLTAVKEGRVYAMDGHHYVNRPGPRVVDTMEYLAGLVHPDVYDAAPRDVARPLAEL
ncbi:ABC transporter substrate-binding protein [Natronomonas sp. EA1]|uniref:ABC transporter substrate-binding protein n=1 Tax=Natronomonas sp. EA1 TaxID=3421655 RepID=UPI003EBFB060